MHLFRAFIAGIVVPTILLPVILCIALASGNAQLLQVPFLHLIPILWGIWNVLYFAIFKPLLPANTNIQYFITGGFLGLLIALYPVFVLDIPTTLGLHNYRYFPLILAPIVYAIFWRYLVKPLNAIVGAGD